MSFSGASPGGSGAGTSQFPSVQGGFGASASNMQQPLVGGMNFGLQNLMKALQASNNTTSAGQQRLKNQYAVDSGKLQQNLVSRGLSNSNLIASQAPREAYNLGMADLKNQGALRSMGVYQNLANLAMQGGSAQSQLLAPLAQQQTQQQNQFAGGQLASMQAAFNAANQTRPQGLVPGGSDATNANNLANYYANLYNTGNPQGQQQSPGLAPNQQAADPNGGFYVNGQWFPNSGGQTPQYDAQATGTDIQPYLEYLNQQGLAG